MRHATNITDISVLPLISSTYFVELSCGSTKTLPLSMRWIELAHSLKSNLNTLSI